MHESAAATIAFAARRLRARPVSLLILAAAVAAAAALIGWSSVGGTLALERATHLALADRPPGHRSLRVLYFTLPLEGDFRAANVEATFRSFGEVLGPVHRVQVSHSLDPNRAAGTRIVVAPRRHVALTSGRWPNSCGGLVCEVLALTGRERIGDRVPLRQPRVAVVVGRGSLAPELTVGQGELQQQALLVPSVPPKWQRLFDAAGSTVVYTAAFRPDAVHAYALASLTSALRDALVRLERGDTLVRPSAPIGVLADLDHRGHVTRDRLLLVSGEVAALIVAFAAFVATSRRHEVAVVEQQLTALGASGRQAWFVRLVEALVPAFAGTCAALAGVFAAAAAIAWDRHLPARFVTAAVPLETVAVIVAVGTVTTILLLAAGGPPTRTRFGVGIFEAAAVTALAVVVWQTWSTGALDASQLSRKGASPVVLMLPALTFFAAGVVLLRVLPILLRLAERATRGSSFAVRLAFLSAARAPAQAAAATTFLAVALGSSLFSLDYRATLERQARDQAHFAAGAAWRVAERGRSGETDVVPLTRYRAATPQRPTPVLRLAGQVVEAYPAGGLVNATVLAVPATKLPQLDGWRRGFSALTRQQIGAKLRPAPVALRGPVLDGTRLRVWARSQTDYPRRIVVHLLEPGQDFTALTLGLAWRRWRLLSIPLPPEVRGSQLVGVEFAPTKTPIDFKYDPQGHVDLGPLEQRRGGAWARVPSVARWREVTSPNGVVGVLNASQFRHAPVERGIRFDLNGTFLPLIHPKLGLPAAARGFTVGPIPALASPTVARQAVDGLVTLDVLGTQVPIRVVATSTLFPTVVDRPGSFLVADYDTVFAALNASQPGLALPSEAWFFGAQSPSFADRLTRPPFRLRHVVGAEELESRLLTNPLASGTRSVLTAAAVIAALIGLIGLILAARSTLAAERLQLAEYEALGVPPAALRRSSRLRLLALSLLGIAAGLVGALATVRLIASFVAVTAAAARPVPPIVPASAWSAIAAVIVSLLVAAIASAALLSGSALRERAGRRLRA